MPDVEGKLDTLQAIELAEGVEIRLRIAGPIMRILALMLDYLIISVVSVVFMILFSIAGFAVGGNVINGVLLLMLFFFTWIYMWMFEAGRWGATPGKKICGLRVTQPSGAPITLGQAGVRNFIRFIDVMPAPFSLIGLTSCLATARFQRLGDLAAGTVVVYDRPEVMPKASGPPPLLPQRPTVALRPEEVRAVVTFRERSVYWSDARRNEIADHLQSLTGSTGTLGSTKLQAMAHWLQENR